MSAEGTGWESNDHLKVINKAETHKNICTDLTELYIRKNKDYGDSYRTQRDKFGDTALLIRLNDKLSRLEKLMITKEQSVKDESIEDTLRDLANYCIMELVEREVDIKE